MMKIVHNILNKCSIDELIELFALDRDVVKYSINNFMVYKSKSSVDAFLQLFSQAYQHVIDSNEKIVNIVLNNILKKVNNEKVDRRKVRLFIRLRLSKTELIHKCFDKLFYVLDINSLFTEILSQSSAFQDMKDVICANIINDLSHEALANNYSNEEIMAKVKDKDTLKMNVINNITDYNFNFDIDMINHKRLQNRILPLYLWPKLSDSELSNLGVKIFNQNKNEFMKELDNLYNMILAKVNAEKFESLDNINIAIGESVPLDRMLFHFTTHTDQYIPLIYVNGNVVVGDAVEDEANGRIHHVILFRDYCKNESLHKFDIIKKPMEEWQDEIKDVSPYTAEMYQLLAKYKVVRAIQSVRGSAIAILFAFNNVEEATRAFKSQLAKCGNVFACREYELERTAKRRRLMYKVQGV